MSRHLDKRPVYGIVVTHGLFGTELLATAESILGPQTDVAAISNHGKSHEALRSEIGSLVDEKLAEGPVALFVDLAAGGCGRVCAPLARRYPNVLCVCGINLSMLIEFLYHRERVDLEELKTRIATKGIEAISCTGWRGEHEEGL